MLKRINTNTKINDLAGAAHDNPHGTKVVSYSGNLGELEDYNDELTIKRLHISAVKGIIKIYRDLYKEACKEAKEKTHNNLIYSIVIINQKEDFFTMNASSNMEGTSVNELMRDLKECRADYNDDEPHLISILFKFVPTNKRGKFSFNFGTISDYVAAINYSVCLDIDTLLAIETCKLGD